VGVLLYLLISGDILYCGLFGVAGGVVAARWRPTLGAGLVWSGLVLALVSAVPIHPLVYAILLLCGMVWQVSRLRATRVQSYAAMILLIVVTGVSGLSVSSRSASGLDLPRNRAVYVLGDSLSAGLGPSMEGTWPQLVALEQNLSVSNLARPGATLATGVFQARAIPDGAATVLLELGGNDLLGGATPAGFRADLRALVLAVAGRERRVVMFELPLVPFQNEYGRIQREVSSQYGVTLLPRWILAGAVALPGHASDGLHLSARGHSWVAARVGELWR
jgi:lysophospholipase L1-like esterase